MEYISPKGGRSVALDEVQSNLATLLRETRPEMPPRDATIMAYWLASEDPAADVLVDLNKILLDTEELAERLGRTTIHAARVARDRQNVLLHPVVEKGQYPHQRRLYLLPAVDVWKRWWDTGEHERRRRARGLTSSARELAAKMRREISNE